MTHLRICATGALVLLLAACASDPDALPPSNPLKAGQTSERELRLEAQELYRLARRSLDSADFTGATERYNRILLRYPFTEFATQAELELIYAKYRSYDSEGALTAAQRFLKAHPRHAAIDYVYYLKGLVSYQRGESSFGWLVDTSQQDVTDARNAFDDFALLTQRFPDSRYAADARLRMIYLRNRIAEHELSVVRYYSRRGAHLAAARRAEKIIADYPGAPATHAALLALRDSYSALGLADSAAEVERLLAANPEADRTSVKRKRPLMERWFGDDTKAAPTPPAPAPEAPTPATSS